MTHTKETLGFIGLGTMGRPMARNLIKAGFPLVFFARRTEVADEFAALGARRAESIREVAQAAGVLITIVTADAQLKEVVEGPQGITEGAGRGKLLIDMSTVSPATAREVAERLAPLGVAFVDAPVSGGPWGAESATLAIMAGGSADDIQRIRPVLEALGKHIFHVGPVGAGQTVKLLNQMVAGGIMTLLGEAFVAAQVAGVDLEQLIDVMSQSSAASAVLAARGKKFVLAGNYQPGFMCELMRKDMALAVELAARLNVPSPTAAAALQQYAAAVAQGHGKEDFAAVAKACAAAAGKELRQKN
ncbi:MAG TPA: NAD(P)-dependent oxidoreductase [Pirellulales bacterium]|nr:NAD(P)-dependent oxidoreductase [Pirellulales bacterium]